MPITNSEIQTGAYRTFFNRSGEGHDETIFFLHGSGPGVTAWSNWQYALPFFDETFQSIAPDLVGFGATQHPANPPTGMHGWMRLWVDQSLALLDALNIRHAHLVGNSMGGAIALHLLMNAPDRFDRVVLMGPIGVAHRLTPELDRVWGFYQDPSLVMFRNIIRWFVYDDTFLGDRLETIARTRYEAAMNPDVERSFRAMFPAPRQRAIDDLVVPDLALRRIANPTLLVHGRDDCIVPPETSLHLLQHLPHAQLHLFGQCSHWTQIEYAQQFNQLLLQFFSKRL